MSTSEPNVGFFPWAIVQCTLPHSKLKLPEDATNPYPGGLDEYLGYQRVNGSLKLYLLGNPSVGLPYGKFPRVLLAWLVREYLRTGDRRVGLGRTMAEFMRELGLSRQGNNYTTVKNQTQRLFSSVVQSLPRDEEPASWDFETYSVSRKAKIWWDPALGVENLFESWVELSDSFVELCERAVPVDIDTCTQFRSPFQIDLYCWLTYRASTIQRPTRPIPWSALMEQFGHGYTRPRDFRQKFRKHLGKVLQRYPVRVEDSAAGVVIYPHAPHVPSRSRTRRPPSDT